VIFANKVAVVKYTQKYMPVLFHRRRSTNHVESYVNL